MTRSPVFGFPGGPPSPPFGDVTASRATSTSNEQPTPPTQVSADPIASTSIPGSHEQTVAGSAAPTAATEHTAATVPWWKVAVAMTSVVAAVAGVVLVSLRMDAQSTPSSPPVVASTPTVPTTPTPTDPTVPPPVEPAAPQPEPGVGLFAPVAVTACADLIGPIGATNAFTSGAAHVPGDVPQLDGTDALGPPVWRVELDDALQTTELLATSQVASRPLRGVVEGRFVLFAPYGATTGSDFGVYRADTGELQWSARIAPGVSVMTDAERMYLVDARRTTLTTLAVVAPASAAVVGCFQAAESELSVAPRPSIVDRTWSASAGRSYVVLPSGDLQVIVDDRVISLGTVTTAGFTDTLPAIEAVIEPAALPQSDADVPSDPVVTVIVSNRQSGSELHVASVHVDPRDDAWSVSMGFNYTVEDLRGAQAPRDWTNRSTPMGLLLEDHPWAAEALPSANGDTTTLRAALSDVHGVYVLLASDAAGTITSISAQGDIRWTGAAPLHTAESWRATNGVLHLSDPGAQTEQRPPTAVLIDGQTGTQRGTVERLQTLPPLGYETLAYTHFYPYNPGYVSVVVGAETVGFVVGFADFVTPIAATSELVVLYVEAQAKRYLLAFVLDPEAVSAADVVS